MQIVGIDSEKHNRIRQPGALCPPDKIVDTVLPSAVWNELLHNSLTIVD